MRVILEWLLVLLTPLFAVAAPAKKTTAKKKAKPSRAITKAEPARAITKAEPARKSGARAEHLAAKPKKKTHARDIKPSRKEEEEALVKTAAPKGPPAPPAPKPPPPIGRAILLIPQNGKYADNVHPTFRWLSVGGATRYEVAWSEDPALTGSHPILSAATEARVPLDRPLRVGATYYWRVRGGNEGGWGPWSPVSSFQVLEASPASQ